jgi:phage gp36-like protein
LAYASQQDLVTRYGERELVQLTDRAEPPAGAIDDAVVARALDDATGEIDSYLAARYGSVLGTAAPVLRDACEILARERLFDDRVTDAVKRDADRVRKWLHDVAAGIALIPDISAGAPQPGPVTYRTGERVFTRDTMADF